ncbi:hypothetical protein IAI43_12075, partial [Streptococcus pseudopneumoniae]|nr:hypothetical protein [Streptococcus pseudopneumoniae]
MLCTARASSAFVTTDGTVATNDLEGTLRLESFATSDFTIEPGDLATNAAGTVLG